MPLAALDALNDEVHLGREFARKFMPTPTLNLEGFSFGVWGGDFDRDGV